jgi:hypothetical protein
MQGDPFGVSFNPTGGPSGPGGQQGQKPSPVQQAIQTLSLKIPKSNGPGAIAPDALLNSPGGGAIGGNSNDAMILEQIRKMLFGTKPGQIGTGPQMPQSGDQGMAPGGGGFMPPPMPGGGGFQPSAQMGAPAPPPQAPQLTPHFTPVEGTGAPGQPPSQPFGNTGGFEDNGEGLQRMWRG